MTFQNIRRIQNTNYIHLESLLTFGIAAEYLSRCFAAAMITGFFSADRPNYCHEKFSEGFQCSI